MSLNFGIHIALTSALYIGALGAIGIGSLYVLLIPERRRAKEVFDDLAAQREEITSPLVSVPQKSKRKNKKSELLTMLLSRKEQKFEDIIILSSFLIAALGLKQSLAPESVLGFVVVLTAGLPTGYLAVKRRKAYQENEIKNQINFYLPVVMERVVMGAQAGLDVVGSVATIIEYAKNAREREQESETDPVTKLLHVAHKRANSGIQFDNALSEVARELRVPALRHAFIHLAHAHREGGELIGPLRELSDSTQLYYQENMEEQIAKLPIKATAPLVCSFAGLILLYLAAPAVQIFGVVANMSFGN